MTTARLSRDMAMDCVRWQPGVVWEFSGSPFGVRHHEIHMVREGSAYFSDRARIAAAAMTEQSGWRYVGRSDGADSVHGPALREA